MSLHTLASQLQSAGRGDDKVLVHMTPGEVKGLQSLAMAHGGSLSINPQTGLPEAGILSSLLPMIAGFFLGPAGIGLTAMQSALTVGALGTAATGSLGKGFMMGMGAYGGAGIGEGLKTVGAQAATPTTSTLAGNTPNVGLNTVDMVPKTTIGGTNTFANAGMEAGLKPMSLSNNPGFGQMNPNSIMSQAAPQGYITNASPMSNYIGNMQANQLNPIAQNVVPEVAASPIQSMSPKLAAPVNTASDLSRGFDRATSGLDGFKEVWDATPKGTGYGLAATGASYLQGKQEEAAAEAKAKADAMAAARRGTVRPYEFSTEQDPSAYANSSTAESNYFVEPRFIAKEPYKVAKEGGIVSLAVGGPVEQMSAANAIGGNMMYPQSQIQTDMYSNPMMQRPMPQNVINSGMDAPVGTYTGEARFGSGGATAGYGTAEPDKTKPKQDLKYTYNPDTMQYTKTETVNPQSQNMGLGLWGGPGYSILNPGPGTYGNQGLSNGAYFGLIPQLLAKMGQSEKPAVTTSTVGGMSAPYVPPGMGSAEMTAAPQQSTMGLRSAIPFVPTTQLPQAQPVNQQLGLDSFYPMMEQQLAMKGAQVQGRGYAEGGTANGGYSLGSYSDGGRLLKGPGDGVSDSIPASIGSGQPARLADGEFVVPARIVSEIGNGSTEAGARKLYAMMDRVQKARGKTVGKNKVAVNTKADRLLPA